MDANSLKQMAEFAEKAKLGIMGLAEMATNNLKSQMAKMPDGMDKFEAAKLSEEAIKAAGSLTDAIKEMNNTPM